MIEKAKIEDTIYDVISYNDYCRNRDAYNMYASSIAIKDGSGYILPIRSQTDVRPGFYPMGGIDIFKLPVGRECTMYNQSNIINFSEAKNLRGVIEAQERLNKAERSILISADSITSPDIYDNDSPFMKAIKTAIIKKHIDLDKYSHRFSENYPNDKRLLKKDDMTMQKGITYANCLDFDMYLIIKDKNPDVPNPIGHPFMVKLTGNGAGFYDGYSEEQINKITESIGGVPEEVPAAYNLYMPMQYYASYNPYATQYHNYYNYVQTVTSPAFYNSCPYFYPYYFFYPYYNYR